jgi:hypothetical protein
MFERLMGEGHRVTVQRSAGAGIAEIEWYLSLPPAPTCAPQQRESTNPPVVS